MIYYLELISIIALKMIIFCNEQISKLYLRKIILKIRVSAPKRTFKGAFHVGTGYQHEEII